MITSSSCRMMRLLDSENQPQSSLGDIDRGSILHQAMGLSRRVRPIFGWLDNLDLLVSTPNGRRDIHVMAQEFQQHPSGILETGSAQPVSINLVIPCLQLSASRSLNISTSRFVPLQHYTGPKRSIRL